MPSRVGVESGIGVSLRVVFCNYIFVFSTPFALKLAINMFSSNPGSSLNECCDLHRRDMFNPIVLSARRISSTSRRRTISQLNSFRYLTANRSARLIFTST